MQFQYLYAVKSFICIYFCNFHVYKWENAYSRDLNAWGILLNFYLLRWIRHKGGGVHWCMYMYGKTESALTTESLTKLGRNKVLMIPAHLHWLLGQIRPGADPGQGHNRSMRGPSPKDFFFRVGRLQQQTECIAMINDLKAFWKIGSILTSSFWHGLVSCIGLSYFDLFSFKYFNGAKCLIYINLCTFLAPLSRRLTWAIVIEHRPSVRRRYTFTFSTSSPEPLDGFWWNLVGMKYSWSLTSVVVFRPDPPGADPGRGKNRSRGVPFFNKLLLQTWRLQQQTECIAMI